MSIEVYKRKAVSCDLNKFDPTPESDRIIRVTEWYNGEGWDISINEHLISLTRGELEAINYLTQHLDINDD